jgi:hypothetical protein
MARLDTWNPGEESLKRDEVDSVVDLIAPANQDVQRRMDALVRTKQYIEREEKDVKGKCNFCGHNTTREFCGGNCERQAAFAVMGKSLKFHD